MSCQTQKDPACPVEATGMLHQPGTERRKDIARKERVSSCRQVLLGQGARDPSQSTERLPRRAQCCQLPSQPGSTG